jgi:Ca2+-binding RTX toxin-like protein
MLNILGLGNSSTTDSIVLNSDLSWTYGQDAIGAIEHEMSEGAMGRIGGLGIQNNSWAPMDLFRYTITGQHDFTGGRDGLATYFSVDGRTILTQYQYHNSVSTSGRFDGFDFADWDHTVGDAFGPGGPGQPGTVSATDLRVMDILGWTPIVINQAPVLAAPFGPGSLSYIRDEAAAPIFPLLSVSDADSANLVGATISITGNFQAGADVLGFVNKNGISGSYDASSGVLTLTGSASVASYQAALDSVTYFNSSHTPSGATRTISYQVDDGASSNHLSNVVTATVTVNPNPPDLTVSNLKFDGQNVSYQVNTFAGAAPVSFTGIYFSYDATVTKQDQVIGGSPEPPLAAGGSYTENYALTLPTGLLAGTYYLGAIANFDGRVQEVDTTNNTSNIVTLLLGDAGNNTLDGRGIACVMVGGAGNDTYLVDNPGDVVVEKGSSGLAFTAPAGWTVKGTADFNSDGKTDVLVTNGMTNQFWLLNSSGAVQSTVAAPTWSGWQLLGLIDYHQDGSPDVLQTNGMMQEVDYLNGTTYAGYTHPSSVLTPDPVGSLGSSDTNTVVSSISYTLPAGVQNLTLSGAGNIDGTGNSLNNVITGNAGNNVLTAGSGIDTLTGAGGIDTFVFTSAYTGGVTGKRDSITDFVQGTDKIDLTGLDSHFGSGYHAFSFIGAAAFDGKAGELHYSYDAAHNVTIVEGDTTGSKSASFGIELTGNLALTTADFTAASLLQPLNLTATANNQTLTGGPFSNTLNDGGFVATLVGGSGNNTFIVGNAGTTVQAQGGLSFTAPAGWTVKGTADFNSDGNTDVLVTNGMVNQFWLLNSSGAVQSQVNAPTWMNGWQLLGLTDYNHDGKPDILQTNGMMQEVDYLNGTT